MERLLTHPNPRVRAFAADVLLCADVEQAESYVARRVDEIYVGLYESGGCWPADDVRADDSGDGDRSPFDDPVDCPF